MSWLKRDPVCPMHGTYPKGSTCKGCRRQTVPGRRPTKAYVPVAKPKKVQPFTCGCGRYVTNSQGICPGENC